MEQLKNILLIDENAHHSSIEDLINAMPGWTCVLAKDEEDAIKCVKNGNVSRIVFEPLLGSDFLITDTDVVERHIEIGATGLVLYHHLQAAINGSENPPKIIFFSLISHGDLMKAGFPEKICYLRKFSPFIKLIDLINTC